VKPCVMHLLSSFEVGGAEHVALNLARSMDAGSFRVSACSMSGPGPMEERFRAAGIETAHIDAASGPMRRLRTGLRLAALLRRLGVTILHCHNAMPLVYGTPAAHLAGVKAVLCTRHAISLTHKPGQPWLLEKLAKPLTAHYVAVSEFVLERGVRTGRIPATKASVIHNGIDTERFAAPKGGRRRAWPLVIGCVGRLSEEKRHRDLVEAAAALVRDGNDLRLDLVGDGETRPPVEAQVRELGVEGRIRFLGMRSDVPELLRGFDIFVLPSRFEGLPLTILEAMASGLPVVATRVGGVPELVEDGVNGFLVEPQSPAELAAAIRRLVEDADLRRRMGQAGRKIAVERFDLRVAARAHEELYRRLLARKGIHLES